MSERQISARVASYAIRCLTAIGLVLAILYTQAFVGQA